MTSHSNYNICLSYIEFTNNLINANNWRTDGKHKNAVALQNPKDWTYLFDKHINFIENSKDEFKQEIKVNIFN